MKGLGDPRVSFKRLAVALLVAAAFAVIAVARFDGPMRAFLLGYFAPVLVPFALLAMERWAERGAWTAKRRLVDGLVLAVAALRAAGAPVAWVSGHALFLVFALLTTRSRLVALSAALVLAQVAALKLALWSDPTLWGGVVAGVLAAALWRASGPSPTSLLGVLGPFVSRSYSADELEAVIDQVAADAAVKRFRRSQGG